MKKLWFDKAWEQFENILRQDSKTAKRINQLLKCIDRNGYCGIGKPEPLKGNLAGWWSVRIDAKNRLVFRISDGALEIYSCAGHYE